MAIKILKKEVSGVRIRKKIVIAVRIGKKLIWEAINSCFGKGFWINEKPWSDTDKWNDGV